MEIVKTPSVIDHGSVGDEDVNVPISEKFGTIADQRDMYRSQYLSVDLVYLLEDILINLSG
jgi:hypothetical protein